MKRKVISSFLVIMMLFSMFHIPFSVGSIYAFAENEGTVIPESELTWLHLGNGNARITGYTGTAKHNLIIPNKVNQGTWTVTELGAEGSIGSNEMVFNSKGLTGSITIPSGVTTLGYQSFQNNKLTTVILPNSLTTIGIQAFDKNEMTAVSIPDSVTRIGYEAFNDNSFENICNLELPSHLDYFSLEYGLPHIIKTPEDLVIPSKINGSEITEVPMISGNGIKSITVPKTITNIGAYAFDFNNFTFRELKKVIFLREGKDWTINEDVFKSDPMFGHGMEDNNSILDTFEIVGHPGSTAETFAQEKNITFVDVSTITIPTNPICGEEELADEPKNAPTNLIVMPTKENSALKASLNFTPSNDADGYIIVRSVNKNSTFKPVDGSSYQVGNNVDPETTIVSVGNESSFIDSDVSIGNEYFYKIYAFNGTGTTTKYLTVGTLEGKVKFNSGGEDKIDETETSISTSFPDKGVDIVFPNGVNSNTDLTVEKNPTEPPNFMVHPNVRRVSPLYFTIVAAPKAPGEYTIVLDFSSLGLSEAQWGNFAILKRDDANSKWQDVVTDLGATIVSRNTDGVWGKFTISGLSSFSQFAGGEASQEGTHEVTSAENAGDGSLRAVLATVQAGDVITFNVPENQINLEETLVIDKDITLRGNNGTALDGRNAIRVLKIADGATVRIENMKIQNGNDGENVVGGILNDGSLTLVNSVVSNNKATGESGGLGGTGGILQEVGEVLVDGITKPIKLVLINTTITANEGASTDWGVGGVAAFGGAVEIYNSIISGNKGQETDVNEDNEVIESYHSLYGGNLTTLNGENNIFAQDPKFVGTGEHPFALQSGSPAMDAGHNNYAYSTLDIRGLQRIVDGRENGTPTIDIGAYEYRFETLPDKLPTATPTLAGTAKVGETLTASSGYADGDGDEESGTTYAFYSYDADGKNETQVQAASATNTYVIQAADAGKVMKVKVMPKNAKGTGVEIMSEATSVIPVQVAVGKTYSLMGALDIANGISTKVMITKNITSTQVDSAYVVFQLMKGSTPVSIIAIEKNLSSTAEEVGVLFNSQYDGHHVNVYVLSKSLIDQQDLGTSLAEAIKLEYTKK